MPRLQGDKDVASCHPVQREVPWRAEVPLLASLLVLPLLQLVMRPLLSRRASVAMAAGSVQATPAYRLVRSAFSSWRANLAVYQRGQKKLDVDEFKHHS